MNVVEKIRSLIQQRATAFDAEEAMKHSVKKYRKTYELLAKYGEPEQTAPILADPENIRGYFQ